MTYFKSLVCVFILLSGVLFQICDVSGQWVNIKNHTVKAKNDSSMEAGGLGGIVGAANTFTITITAKIPIGSGNLYVWEPGDLSSNNYMSTSFFPAGPYETSVPVSFTFPEDASLGEWTFQVETSSRSNALSSVTSQSYTVTVQ